MVHRPTFVKEHQVGQQVLLGQQAYLRVPSSTSCFNNLKRHATLANNCPNIQPVTKFAGALCITSSPTSQLNCEQLGYSTYTTSICAMHDAHCGPGCTHHTPAPSKTARPMRAHLPLPGQATCPGWAHAGSPTSCMPQLPISHALQCHTTPPLATQCPLLKTGYVSAYTSA